MSIYVQHVCPFIIYYMYNNNNNNNGNNNDNDNNSDDNHSNRNAFPGRRGRRADIFPSCPVQRWSKLLIILSNVS